MIGSFPGCEFIEVHDDKSDKFVGYCRSPGPICHFTTEH
jgi:hypothetical protein